MGSEMCIRDSMTTDMAVADVPAPMVLGTLLAYLAVYASLLIAYVGVIAYLAGKAARGVDARPDSMSHSGKANVVALNAAE